MNSSSATSCVCERSLGLRAKYFLFHDVTISGTLIIISETLR